MITATQKIIETQKETIKVLWKICGNLEETITLLNQQNEFLLEKEIEEKQNILKESTKGEK